MGNIIVLFACLLFIACSAQNSRALPPEENNTSDENVVVQVSVSADEMHLEEVMRQMSVRALKAITITDKKQFLEDLHDILEADKLATANGDISLLYLADKKHYLPEGYKPREIIKLTESALYTRSRNDLSLRKEAYEAFLDLATAAKKDGVTLMASSTYRSYEYQIEVYNRWVRLEGQEMADRESARPGTSQHQLGTVIDFGSIDDTFAQTRAGKWMAQNAWQYGWSLSFPDGYEDVTGYRWECWHFRYIGLPACTFQRKYFSDIQQFMLEFIDAWRSVQQNYS